MSMHEFSKDTLTIFEDQSGQKHYMLKNIDGMVPFVTNPVGFNPGIFIQRYVHKLSSDTPDLFPSPLRFHEFRPSDSVWFRGVRIGKNRPDMAMQEIGNVLGKDRFVLVDFHDFGPFILILALGQFCPFV